MKWAKIFTRQTLESGSQIFEQGKIRDEVEITHNAFICTVDGTERFRVKVMVPEPYRIQVSCTCSVGMDGFRCRHMVAAMMKLDQLFDNWLEGTTRLRRKTPSALPTVRVIDFPETDVNTLRKQWMEKDSYLLPYNAFDMQGIFSDRYRVMPGVLERAKKLVESGAATITSQTVNDDDSKDELIQFTMEVTINEGMKPIKVRLSCSFKELLLIRCYSERCQSYPNFTPYDGNVLCEHQVAAMLLLYDALEKAGDIDMTDETGQLMISQFTGMNIAEKAESMSAGQVIRLLPFILHFENRLILELRCGSDRDYAVKSIRSLVNAYQAKGMYQLWKTNYVNFRIDRFDKQSEALIHMLRRAVIRNDSMTALSNSSYGAKDSSIELDAAMMDEFANIYMGRQVFISGKERFIEDGVPQVHLDIHPMFNKAGRFKGINVSGKLPEVIRGVDYVYFKRGTKLVRVPYELMEKVQPVYGINFDNTTVDFDIGRQRMGEFYHKILPAMAEVFEIDDYAYATAEAFIPPEGKMVFYLDCNDDFLLCSAKVFYGEYSADLMKRGEHASFFRDLFAEKPAYDIVAKWFPRYNETNSVCMRWKKDDAVFTFLRSGLPELQALGEVQASAEFRKLKIRRGFRPQMGVAIDGNLLELSILSEEYSQDELLEILQSYQKKKHYHVLRNGDYLDLSDTADAVFEFLNSTDVSLKDFVNGKMHLPVYRMLYLNEMLKAHDEIISTREETFLRLIDRFEAAKEANYPVPASLKDTLRAYQVTGFQWMERILSCGFCGILADDMGLGKTLQIITVLLSDKNTGRSKGMPSLITCPASLVYNWQKEFTRFAPELTVQLVVGPIAEREKRIEQYRNFDVLVTSYDLMKRDIDKYEGKRFWLYVLDEAQYIKNQVSSAAKSAKIVEAEHRMALTGTPIENRLSELWSIFDFLMPGFLFSYSKFHDEIETPAVKFRDEEAMDRLRRMVSPFIMRRLKKDVLQDLPEKTEETRYITLSGEQQKLYNAQVEKIRIMLNQGSKEGKEGKEEDGKERFKILAEIMRLRQICCDPRLVFENYTGESTKREELISLLKEAIESGHKILVFSQFTSMMELIEADLNTESIPFYHLSGSTPKQERVRLADSFNTDDTPVFMISLKAGGTGLNLIGADIVIHFEPWWNVAVMNQATDRAHRIGQVHPVTVFNFIAKGTIEERVQELQESKKELAEGILNGEAGVFNRLSKEELLELLSGPGE